MSHAEYGIESEGHGAEHVVVEPLWTATCQTELRNEIRLYRALCRIVCHRSVIGGKVPCNSQRQ